MTHIITQALALAAGNCIEITLKVSGSLSLKNTELNYLPWLTISVTVSLGMVLSHSRCSE